MEMLTTLGVNVGMLVAQAINFGVLLLILSYFLYRPLLRVLDERSQRIQKSMEDSKRIDEQVKAMERDRAATLKELDAKSSAILADAKKQADTARAEMMKAAQQETDAFLERGRQLLQDEKRKMVTDLEKTVTKLSVKLAGKILEREFSSSDQDRILKNLEKDISSLVR